MSLSALASPSAQNLIHSRPSSESYSDNARLPSGSFDFDNTSRNSLANRTANAMHRTTNSITDTIRASTRSKFRKAIYTFAKEVALVLKSAIIGGGIGMITGFLAAGPLGAAAGLQIGLAAGITTGILSYIALNKAEQRHAQTTQPQRPVHRRSSDNSHSLFPENPNDYQLYHRQSNKHTSIQTLSLKEAQNKIRKLNDKYKTPVSAQQSNQAKTRPSTWETAKTIVALTQQIKHLESQLVNNAIEQKHKSATENFIIETKNTITHLERELGVRALVATVLHEYSSLSAPNPSPIAQTNKSKTSGPQKHSYTLRILNSIDIPLNQIGNPIDLSKAIQDIENYINDQLNQTKNNDEFNNQFSTIKNTILGDSKTAKSFFKQHETKTKQMYQDAEQVLELRKITYLKHQPTTKGKNRNIQQPRPCKPPPQSATKPSRHSIFEDEEEKTPN